MEGYRGYSESSYPESAPTDPGHTEPSWYGERAYRSPDPYPEQYEEAYDEQQRRDPGRVGRSAVGPRPGPQAAPQPSPSPQPPPHPGSLPGEEPSLGRRPMMAPGSPSPASDGVYRSRRPAVALLIGIPAAILELPALRLLIWGMLEASASSVVSAACLVLALPLLAIGLYAVATGAVKSAGPNSVQAWLRPPVAYLSVSLVLFLAAGLAA